MHQVAHHFEVVLWRSLRDAPTCEMLLDDCLQVLSPEVFRDVHISLEKRIRLLLECMRRMRVLLVLDNLETLLEEGLDAGTMRAGFEGYSRLLHLMAETEHQSCLLLTSREKPRDLVPLEGNRGQYAPCASPVWMPMLANNCWQKGRSMAVRLTRHS
jgi:hypothetical protein